MRSLMWMGPLFLIGMLIGCAAHPTDIIQDEGFLSAGGFRVIRADDSEKRRNLATLPAHRLVTETKGGAVYYVYADSTVCGCIYFGDEETYQEYRRLALNRHLTHREAMKAKPDQRIALDWAVWGNPGWWLG